MPVPGPLDLSQTREFCFEAGSVMGTAFGVTLAGGLLGLGVERFVGGPHWVSTWVVVASGLLVLLGLGVLYLGVHPIQ